MTQESYISVSFAERIETASASALIEKARFPLSEEARKSWFQLLEAEEGQIAESVVARQFSELRTAEADEEAARERTAAARRMMTAAEETAAAAHSGASWVKVAMWGLCAAACFAAEFVLSWNALCFVLNVDKISVLGILLGLAPPSGLAVLEICIARLLEDPWQRLRKVSAAVQRWAVNLTMAGFLIALAVGNGITILHLAKAREEASKAARIYNDVSSAEEEFKIDEDVIDRAVLWVSMIVSWDGAVFLLLCLRDGVELRHRLAAIRAAHKARADCARLEAELSKSVAHAACVREAWRVVEQTATMAAKRYRAHCTYKLAERATAARLEQPIEELVEQSFRLQIPA